jgi:hypothetical protein
MGDFKVEVLVEFESIGKKALTRISVAQMELFVEKNRGIKSLDTVPLSRAYSAINCCVRTRGNIVCYSQKQDQSF